MAGYRQFHTKFWKDEWLISLEPMERYLFSYLFTNDLSSISGIYKIPFKVIQNETDLEKEYLLSTLKKFEDAGKIFYRDGVMWVVKMAQHHKNASPKTMAKVRADVAEISDCDVKLAYLYYQETGIYSIDMVSIHKWRSASLKENKKENTSEPPPVNVFSFYESEIGALTPMIADDLKDAEIFYTAEWVMDAIKEAVKNNARNWAYALAILKRWKKDGRIDKRENNNGHKQEQPAGVMRIGPDGEQKWFPY